MNRRTKFLLVALVLSVIFAAWQWLQPYEWFPDKGALYKIEYATVKSDHGYCWVDLELKRAGEANHEVLKPVTLTAATGHEFQPADTTFQSEDSLGTTAIFLRFWLEQSEMSGPLTLKLNDGSLNVRRGSGVPVQEGNARTFYTNHW